MVTESTKLVTTFQNSEHNDHLWTYKDVDTSLSAQEIKEACELLTTLDIFEQDGVKLFDSVVTAKFVSTKVTTLFDLKNDIDVKQPEIETATEPACEEVGCYAVATEKNEPTPAKLQLPVAIVPVNKARLPQKSVAPVKHPTSVATAKPCAPQPAEQPLAKETQTKKGLLRQIFRRRKRKKDDPTNHDPST